MSQSIKIEPEALKISLNRISQLQWDKLKSFSVDSSYQWNSRHDWLNTKFYKNNPPNHGDVMQTPINGESPEIPYSRNIFKIKQYRFSLIDRPVAYFSSDVALMSCETIAILRESYRDSWKKHLKPYLDGSVNLSPDAYGYPLNFRLKNDISILDLRMCSNTLKVIEEYLDMRILDLIMSPDEEHYYLTQLVAEAAFCNDFDGIAYDSVREPCDVNIVGNNIVIFDENKIERYDHNET